LRLDGVFPDAAQPRARWARGAAVLGWCSPQSSVPRQTVGHHARAAMYDMGQTAACEGCRGEVPRASESRLDIPPTGAWDSLLIYPPTVVQPRARPGGLWGGFPDPAKLICMGFAKNGLASSRHQEGAPRGLRGAEAGREPHAARNPTSTPVLPFPRPQPLLCLLLSHIPTDRGAAARTARRALGWISRSRKTLLYGFR
jgi:hypothetical protein